MCEDAERLEESLDTDAAHAPFGEDIGFGWQGLERRLDRIAEVAKELVALDCDVIFAAGPYAIEALMKATATIPIVGIDLESDPIANGWVVSIARPGRNLTGFSSIFPTLAASRSSC